MGPKCQKLSVVSEKKFAQELTTNIRICSSLLIARLIRAMLRPRVITMAHIFLSKYYYVTASCKNNIHELSLDLAAVLIFIKQLP